MIKGCDCLELVEWNEKQYFRNGALDIFLIGYSEAYLQEWCTSSELMSHVKGGFDSSSRKCGAHEFAGLRIEIRPMDEIHCIPSDSIILIFDDYHNDVFKRLKNVSEIRTRFSCIYYYPNKETRYYFFYLDKYKDIPLKNVLVFRSGPHASGYVHGMDFADNARALFDYMLQEGYNNRYELVWLVNSPEEFQERYSQIDNVKFLPYSGAISDDIFMREAYYEAICLAKFIFFTDAYGFCRYIRPGQIRVQLWHGCGIKRRVNFVPCESRYEYMTVISKMYAELHGRDYGLREQQLLVTGYPKEDWLFHPLGDWRKKFKIPEAKKYVFWLPTFRTTAVDGLKLLDEGNGKWETGLPIVSSHQQIKLLNSFLCEKNVVLILKLHPFQRRESINVRQCSNIVFLENEDLFREDVALNQILGHADALISDYSSAAIDYSILDRPIAFTLDDWQEYNDSRGFNWPAVRDWLPGVEIYTFDEFKNFINDIAVGRDISAEKRRCLNQEFHDFFDDKSSERIIKALGI